MHLVHLPGSGSHALRIQHVSKNVLRQYPEGPDPTLSHSTSVHHALDFGVLAQRWMGRKWLFKTPGCEEAGAELGVFLALIRAVFSSPPGFPSVQLSVAHWAAQTPSPLRDFGKVPFFSLAFTIWLLAPGEHVGESCTGACGWDPDLSKTQHAALMWELTKNINK